VTLGLESRPRNRAKQANRKLQFLLLRPGPMGDEPATKTANSRAPKNLASIHLGMGNTLWAFLLKWPAS